MHRPSIRWSALALVGALATACGGGSGSGPDGSGGTTPACDPTDTSACGGPAGGAVCVAHSQGNVAACEPIGEPGPSQPDLGCWACRTAADCPGNNGGCIDGSCREPTGYDWVKYPSVMLDDATLGARCCPTGHVNCAPQSDGSENCTCVP